MGDSKVLPVTLPELEASLSMLRKQGVKTFTDIAGGGFTVEFFPTEVEAEAAKPSKDDEQCACGHHLHIQHMNGLCVEGCTEEECNPVQKA